MKIRAVCFSRLLLLILLILLRFHDRCVCVCVCQDMHLCCCIAWYALCNVTPFEREVKKTTERSEKKKKKCIKYRKQSQTNHLKCEDEKCCRLLHQRTHRFATYAPAICQPPQLKRVTNKQTINPFGLHTFFFSVLGAQFVRSFVGVRFFSGVRVFVPLLKNIPSNYLCTNTMLRTDS